MLDNVTARTKMLEVDISFTEEAVSAIADKGFDPVYGARPLRRAITSQIEDLISEEILLGKIGKGDRAICDFREGKFIISKN